VVNAQGNELGRVKEITYLGAHDLLLVKAGDGKEAMIPVVEGVVLAIAADQSLITVDPPPGLLEAQGWSAEAGGEPGDGSEKDERGDQDGESDLERGDRH
jgi:hypothetical protein